MTARLRDVEIFYLYAIVTTFCLIGLLPVGSNLNLWSAVFDGFFITYIVVHIAISGTRVPYVFMSAISFIYLSINFALYYINYRGFFNPLDVGELKNFLYINKFVLYGALISLSPSPNGLKSGHIKNIFFILLACFAFKYTYSKILLSGNLAIRPVMVTENNFELMFLLIFYYLFLIDQRRNGVKHSLLPLSAVIYVVVISGSRSSLLAVACIIGFEFIKPTAKHIISFFIFGPVFFSLAYIVFMIRQNRIGGNSREIFLDVFISEVSKFNLFEHMFGVMPITPLSPESCDSLAFWKDLFSATGDGKCYSVIMHSFFMRVYFDHGIFGILLVFVMAYFALRRGSLSIKDAIGVLSIPTVCALSVSSFASAFVSLPIALICGWRASPAPRRIVRIPQYGGQTTERGAAQDEPST